MYRSYSVMIQHWIVLQHKPFHGHQGFGILFVGDVGND